MTPDSANPATQSAAQISQSLFQFWLMPMRMAQSMFEMTSQLIETSSDAAKSAVEQATARAEKVVERSAEATQHVVEEAEEKIAKLDDTRGDTVVNPAALVS